MKRSISSAVGVSLLIAAMLIPAPVAAKSPPGSRVAGGGVGHPAFNLRKADLSKLPSLSRNERQMLFIQLSARPVTSYQAAQLETAGTKLSETDKASIRAGLVKQQSQISGRITAIGARIQSSFTDTLNGFRVLATPAQAAQISRLPGVTKIYQVPEVQRSDLQSADYVKAIDTWTDNGLTGKGVTIAIIDTGINYYHKNFGGTGNPGFKNDNSKKIEPGTFPTAKVVGGYDFVGDNYNPDGTAAQQVPHPDPDPLDCKTKGAADVQHGSHVAGIAAGDGVKANGATYTGPYTASAVNSTNFRIGPGIAPQAKLAAYRVFGCDGASYVVQDAIERATRDGVDVINMSLGSDMGGPDSIDSIAANAAAASGIVVVAAAGNAGPSAYEAGSPGAAQRVISVGAVDGSQFLSDGAIIDFPGSVTDIGGWNMYETPLPVSGTMKVILDGSNVSEGCAASDFSSVSPGDIVAIARGTCAFSDKRGFAEDAGAAAVVLVNNESATVVNPVPDPDHTIPMISINPSHVADLAAGDGLSTSLHDGSVLNENFGTPASFTSAGPGRITDLVKPDLMAPGVDVVSTDGATVNKGKALSGTSMATPQVAGAAALVLQAHPGWRPAAVKGALVGTSDPSAVDPYTVQAGGAGVINTLRATRTVSWAESVAFPGTSSLAFGYNAISINRTGGNAYQETQSFRLRNTSNQSITYNLSDNLQTSGMGFVVSMPSSVSVPANGSSVVNVTLSLSNAAAAALPDVDPNDGPTVGVSTSLYVPLINVAGEVIATPTTSGAGHAAVRVPWIVVPRATSEMGSAQRSPFTGSAVKHATVNVKNHGVHDGNVDVFAWGLSDQQEGQGSIDLRAAGVQALPTEFCTGTADPNNACLIFAVNVWQPWDSGAQNEYDVDIDTNKDGVPDFAVVGIDYAAIFGPGANEGVPISLVLDLRGATPAIVDVWFAAAPPNGSTILLPVLASELDRDPAHPRIFYDVESFPYADGSADPGNPVFQFDVMGTGQSGTGASGAAHFDAFNNPISNGDFFSLNPGDSVNVPISVRTANYHPVTRGQKGWMFVNMEGRDGAGQANLIPVGSLSH